MYAVETFAVEPLPFLMCLAFDSASQRLSLLDSSAQAKKRVN